MQAPGIVLIFATNLRHGKRLLERGDRYDRQALAFSEEVHRGLTLSGQVVPLTRETYAAQMAHRPPGTVGRGFTAAMLLEDGIISAEQAEQAPTLPADVVLYKGYRIVTWVAGIQRLKGVENPAGEPMRAQRFQSLEKAQRFIDALPPLKESTDGSHVPAGADASA